MELTMEAKDILKALRLIAALSSCAFLILLFIVAVSNPDEAIDSMIRDLVLEVSVSVLVGIMVSIILLVLGMIDSSAG
jgi:hypothetical protein